MKEAIGRSLLIWTLAMLPFLFSVQAGEQPEGGSLVAAGIPVPVLERDLLSRHTVHLGQMMEDPDKRREYVVRLSAAQQAEGAIVEKGLAQDQPLLESLRNARDRLVLDALVRHEMAGSVADIEQLARERFRARPDGYKVPKKIKLAVIFVSKKSREEAAAQALIKDILAQLQAEPSNEDLFHQLAREHSDDKKASQGGIIEKWLIAPPDLEDRDPLMKASFAMETVGQITEIVETEAGLAIAKLLSVTPAIPASFEAARGGIEKEIRSQLYQRTKTYVWRSMQPPEDLAVDDELLLQKIQESLRAREPVATEGE